MKPRLFLTLCLLLVLCCGGAASDGHHRPARLRAAIDGLDRAIADRQHFRDLRHLVIDSLRMLYDENPTFETSRRLGAALAGFDADSAYHFYQRAYDLALRDNDESKRYRLMLDYVELLQQRMLYSDALAVLDSIDTKCLDRRGRIDYYSHLGRAYLSASQQHSLRRWQDDYRARALAAFDSLASFFPAGSAPRRLTDSQIYYIKGDTTLGVGELNEVFENSEPDYMAYAALTGMLAEYYRNKPASRDEYLYYLAMSATADVRSANGEPVSLVTLASELFSDGEADRAYTYLQAAAEALNASKSALLSTDIIYPLVAVNRHILDREASIQTRYRTILLVSGGALLVLAMLFVLRQRHLSERDRQIKSMADGLTSREMYINQLLEICSVYLESMEDFNRLVGRKLKAGQSKDLYSDVESGKWLRECNDRFFLAFDTAVLKIFPAFTAQLNSLLLPDKPLLQPAPDRLSPEQRIVAFMRLGVTDSTKISKFLGLSLTTVYTYRNRVKSRAADKENFEKNIRSIGKIAYV